LIKDALMDPDIQEMPTDYTAGLDFRITKTTKGQYADYSTSKWARKETAITEAQAQAIETSGLHTLSDFLPKKPTEVELQCIKEMFEASVDGQPYDVERWGQYYRPYGIDAPAGSSSSSTSTATAAPTTPAPAPAATPSPIAAAPAPAPQVETVAAPAAAPQGESKRAEDILAMIRNRQS
jgi:hypothetical protein